MKLKYYLRGLGIGIIVTTLILMLAFSQYKNEMSDAEIIKRAETLGMVMKEDKLFGNQATEMDTTSETEAASQTELTTEETQTSETELPTEAVTDAVTETETETEEIVPTETEAPTELPVETEVSTESEVADSSQNAESETGDTYHLVIASGAIPRLICAELEENGVIADAASLRQYLTDVGFIKYITIGEYDIPYGSTNEEVYQILKAGSPLFR